MPVSSAARIELAGGLDAEAPVLAVDEHEVVAEVAERLHQLGAVDRDEGADHALAGPQLGLRDCSDARSLLSVPEVRRVRRGAPIPKADDKPARRSATSQVPRDARRRLRASASGSHANPVVGSPVLRDQEEEACRRGASGWRS